MDPDRASEPLRRSPWRARIGNHLNWSLLALSARLADLWLICQHLQGDLRLQHRSLGLRGRFASVEPKSSGNRPCPSAPTRLPARCGPESNSEACWIFLAVAMPCVHGLARVLALQSSSCTNLCNAPQDLAGEPSIFEPSLRQTHLPLLALQLHGHLGAALLRVLAESGAKSRNKQGESREPGRVESGIKEESRETRGAGVGSRETWTKETCDLT